MKNSPRKLSKMYVLPLLFAVAVPVAVNSLSGSAVPSASQMTAVTLSELDMADLSAEERKAPPRRTEMTVTQIGNPNRMLVRADITFIGWCNSHEIFWGDVGMALDCGPGTYKRGVIKKVRYTHEYAKPGRYMVRIAPEYGRAVNVWINVTRKGARDAS